MTLPEVEVEADRPYPVVEPGEEPEPSTMRQDIERSADNLDAISRNKQAEMFQYMLGAQPGLRGSFANMLSAGNGERSEA